MEDTAVRDALKRIQERQYSFGHVSAVVYPDFRRTPPVYAGFECSIDKRFVDGLARAINARANPTAKIEIIALEEGHDKANCIAEIIPANAKGSDDTRQFFDGLPEILCGISRQYGAAKAEIEKHEPKRKGKEWMGIHPHFHNSRRI